MKDKNVSSYQQYVYDCMQEEDFGHWIFRVSGQFFFRLIGANMLFLLACIPVVTVPAALCGLHAVVQSYYRNLHGNTVFQLFKKEFMESFWSRTGLFGFLIAIPISAVALIKPGNLSPISLVCCAFLFLLVLLVLSWFIPQLVMLNLKPMQALKNAFLLTCIETKTNFLLMLIHAVGLSVMIFGLPLSVFFLLLLPVAHVVLVTPIVIPVIRAHLVQENAQGE